MTQPQSDPVDPLYEEAKARVAQLRGFYSHLASYVLVNVMLFVINVVSSPGRWWFYWVTVFWGLGLLAHGVSVFTNAFGHDWEQRKIQQYVDKKRGQ